MSWNTGGNRNLFLKLNSMLGLYHLVHTNPKTCSQKLPLTVVVVQQLLVIEETNSTEKIFS